MKRFTMAALAAALLATAALAPTASAGTIGGVNLGQLTDNLFVFADGGVNGVIDYNLQAATKGYQGNIAVNGIAAGTDLRTSGHVAYQGTMFTNAANLDSWQAIIDDNNAGGNFPTNNASAVYNAVGYLATLQGDLNTAFTQINGLSATAGYTSVSATSLDGLNTQNGINETIVINVTSGFSVSSKIEITGDAGDTYVLRWDTDANSADGYNGQVKFQSGGAIVPHGGLTPGNFINVAGDLDASGGGTTPASPYPQGVPIDGGDAFNGGGFFTGYWLTTGDPTNQFKTHSLSNAIFVGGWYTSTSEFSLTSGSSGVYVAPPEQPPSGVPLPAPAIAGAALLAGVGAKRRRRDRLAA